MEELQNIIDRNSTIKQECQQNTAVLLEKNELLSEALSQQAPSALNSDVRQIHRNQ